MIERGLQVALPYRRTSAPEAVDLAVRAERAGWEGLWTPEVFALDALVLQGALARATSRVRLGTSIVPLSTRSVALLAMASSTIAQLAPGRFSLGIGVSTPAIVEQRHDRPVTRPLAETRGTLEVLRALLDGERVDRDADPRVRSLRIEKPEHKPDLILAALGPKMVGLAHELADGVLLNLLPPDAVPGYVEQGRAAGGAGFETLLLARVCVEPTDDDRRAVAREVASYCRVGAYAANFVRHGYELEEVQAADDLQAAAEQLPEGLVDDLVIMGSPRECRERLQQLAASGVTSIVMAAGTDGSLDRLLDQLAPP